MLNGWSIPNPLASSAMARPEHLGVRTERGERRLGELAEAAARIAGGLASRDVLPGQRVALWGDASLPWVEAFHGIGWLGAAVCPLPRQTPDVRVRELVHAIGARILLTSDMETEVRARALLEGTPVRVVGVSELMEAQPLPERPWPLEEVRWVILTSGTQGTPRLVENTTGQLVFSAFGSAVRMGHLPSDRWLCCLPLHHVAGLSILMRSALYGISTQLHRSFDAGRVAAALDSGDVSLVSLVPTMLERVLDARPERPFPAALRAILLGGGPASRILLDRCVALEVPVAQTWGMSETASQVATNEPSSERLESPIVAPPLPFVRIAENEGRLDVTGPVAPHGSYRTSDRGEIRADGWVRVSGRADDVILSGGEKTDPLRVESVLRAHPDIRDAVVVGLPSAQWGRQVVAVVVRRAEHTVLTREDLRGWCSERLEPHEVPKLFLAGAFIARNALGKISRPGVTEQLSTGSASGDQVVLLEGLDELGGNLQGREGLHVDKRVHGLSSRVRLTSGADDLVRERDGALSDSLDAGANSEFVTESNGSLEVGLRMNDGHAPRTAPKDASPISHHGGHEILESSMAVLEHTREEHHSSGVDLIEPGGDAIIERHSNTPTSLPWRKRS